MYGYTSGFIDYNILIDALVVKTMDVDTKDTKMFIRPDYIHI